MFVEGGGEVSGERCRSGSPSLGLFRQSKSYLVAPPDQFVARSEGFRSAEALSSLREGPGANKEMDGGDSKVEKLGHWKKGQLSHEPSDLRLLLGVLGTPLAPAHVSSNDPFPHLSIKDTPTASRDHKACPGVWEYVCVNVYELSVEQLSVSEYLHFKEELANEQVDANYMLELDFEPFNATFPRPTRSSYIGNGVQFLNLHLSSIMFRNKDSLEPLLDFLLRHKYKGYAFRCIGDLIAGHLKNLDTIASKVLREQPYEEPALNFVLRIILRTSSMQEFLAADYIFKCFCETNFDGQKMLASTLIPQPHSMIHAPLEEDVNMSFGSMLLRGLTMSENDGDLETCCRAASVLSYVLKDNIQCKEKVLRIELEGPMLSIVGMTVEMAFEGKGGLDEV